MVVKGVIVRQNEEKNISQRRKELIEHACLSEDRDDTYLTALHLFLLCWRQMIKYPRTF
jgi:hypothetical protein